MHKTFTVKNYPESVLAEKLESWEVALPECIKLAYLPKLGIIRLRLTGRGRDGLSVKLALEKESRKLEEILGDDIFDEEDTPLEILVGNLLKKKNTVLLFVLVSSYPINNQVHYHIQEVPTQH